MKKRIIPTLCIALAMITCIYASAFAASNLEQIQAYLNYGITIKLNGQAQSMYDAKGTKIYPISYKGTTYVPIRAVSNMLDVDITWDGGNNAILLGNTGTAKDFIEEFKPYDGLNTYMRRLISDGKKAEIAGKTYDHYIGGSSMLGSDFHLYYDLGGKYKTLTFQLYSTTEKDLYFYGDNNELLKKITVTGKALPQTYTVDLTNVQQLSIKGYEVYIFNATIE